MPVPTINARLWYLYALACVWVIMGFICAGMLIAGKAKLYPDIAFAFGILLALTIFQVTLLFVLGWISRRINRGIDKAFEAFEEPDE